MKRFVALLIAVGAAQPVPAIRAEASEPRTEFRSETKGSPVATEVGQWVVRDGGKRVELIFKGGHLIGAGTTFSAVWITPFTTADEPASYEGTFEYRNENELGQTVRLVQSFRFRERGGRWSRWQNSRKNLRPGSSGGLSGRFFFGFGEGPMQFQWRLEGEIVAPSYLEGHFEGRVN